MSKRKNITSLSWNTAILITVSKHRNKDYQLIFGEEQITRKQVTSDYERVWAQDDISEDYQQRISDLLNEGNVVLKVVG
jgi:hypothetical protein